MNGLGINIMSSLIASALFSITVLLLFDVRELRRRLFKMFGIRPSRTFVRLTSREQVVREFNNLFVKYEVKRGGRILLMSNSGGYPEYDPYIRILELAAHPNIEIYLAVAAVAMKAYWADMPQIARRLVEAEDIRLFVFSTLTPYKLRIGVNTELGKGFVCAYYGHRDNKVDLEGIRSDHSYFVEAFEAMYMGLLRKGTEITLDNISELSDARHPAETRGSEK